MTALLPVPGQLDINNALRAFLLSVLPEGMSIIRGQVNRVPEPATADFVVFWPLYQRRIQTNVDAYADSAFTASIAGTVMTVSSVELGTITPITQLFGANLAGGTVVTRVTEQLTGSIGGVGTYRVGPSQTALSGLVSAGSRSAMQASELVIQVDVHGPNSWNNAQTITTLFRDAYGVDQFAEQAFPIVPLYADDPKQIPFVNAENQYEDRWVVEAHLQANQTVAIPQQFADVVDVTLKEVEATFPP